MTIWDQVQQAISDFYGWLSGLGAGFTDTLGELGSWISQGLSSLGAWLNEAFNRLKEGLEWLGSKVVEAYNWLAQGFNWLAGQIGAGLTYIATGLQNIGQWIWNGIQWIGQQAVNALQSLWNWIAQQVINVWNWIVERVEGFVNEINQWWTNFVKSLRDKFKYLIIVNLTIPLMWRSTEKLIEDPSWKTFGAWIASPFVGLIAGELMDVLVPRPSSTIIQLFPPLKLPTWDYQPIEVPIPPTPTPPPTVKPATLPTVGYTPIQESVNSIKLLYDVRVVYPYIRIITNSIKIEPTTEVLTPIYTTITNSISGVGSIVYSGYELAEQKLLVGIYDTYFVPTIVDVYRDIYLKTVVEAVVSPIYEVSRTNRIIVVPDVKVELLPYAESVNSLKTIVDIIVDTETILERVNRIAIVPEVRVYQIIREAVLRLIAEKDTPITPPASIIAKLLALTTRSDVLSGLSIAEKTTKIGESTVEEVKKPPGYSPPSGIATRVEVIVKLPEYNEAEVSTIGEFPSTSYPTYKELVVYFDDTPVVEVYRELGIYERAGASGTEAEEIIAKVKQKGIMVEEFSTGTIEVIKEEPYDSVYEEFNYEIG